MAVDTDLLYFKTQEHWNYWPGQFWDLNEAFLMVSDCLLFVDKNIPEGKIMLLMFLGLYCKHTDRIHWLFSLKLKQNIALTLNWGGKDSRTSTKIYRSNYSEASYKTVLLKSKIFFSFQWMKASLWWLLISHSIEWAHQFVLNLMTLQGNLPHPLTAGEVFDQCL